MEIRHLKYFLTVAEELNFTKASEKLCISQPPLSRQIKELENEINATLFSRSNKRVELTDAGKYFEAEVRQLLQKLDAITVKTRKINENISGEFRIAYISSTFSNVISDLIRFLSNQYPYVNFKLYEVPTTEQINALEQGKLDLGILRGPLRSPGIRSKVWFRDGYSLVFNKRLLRLKSEADIPKLKEEVFVFFNKDYAPHYYNSLMEICTRYGFTPNVVHESNNINSIIQLVRNGLGVSIVPSSLSKTHSNSELGFFEFKKAGLSSEVLLAARREENSEIIRKAISFLIH